MHKQKVIDFFGSLNLTAEAMGITTQAVVAWPDELTKGGEARVAIVIVQSRGLSAAKRAFPKTFELTE